MLRKSINVLTPAELTKIQSAYTALRALPASDKRTWVLQADMHALFCDSCNNSPFDIHGSWSSFPWHRAYLYYYERFTGSLVGDLNGFRLPYWDWENVRTLPTPYRSPGSAADSMWDGNRSPAMAGGGTLPATHGTTSRINTLPYGLTDFAAFGGSAGGSGSAWSLQPALQHSYGRGPSPGLSGASTWTWGPVPCRARSPVLCPSLQH